MESCVDPIRIKSTQLFTIVNFEKKSPEAKYLTKKCFKKFNKFMQLFYPLKKLPSEKFCMNKN